MANFFKDWIFNQLPKVHQVGDTLYKDVNGDGLLKRYLRVPGMELDANFMPFMDNFLNLIDLIQCDDKFLPLIGGILGYPPSISGDNPTYRKVLAYAVAIYKVKGTLKSFQILFNLIGLDIDIKEAVPKKEVKYDLDPAAIYDNNNIYDSDCDHCSGFWILWRPTANPCNIFNGDLGSFSASVLASINNIICFLTPINATYLGIIRDLNACDTFTLNPTDLSNFCSNPTNLNFSYDGVTSATITWAGTGTFQIQYRVFPSGTFGVPAAAASGVVLTGLLGNTLYEVQVRQQCSVSSFSNWVSVYVLTGNGIFNNSGVTLNPTDLDYILHFSTQVLSDNKLGIDFTNPLNITNLILNGSTIAGPGVISNSTALLAWLNTLGLSGTFILDADNNIALIQTKERIERLRYLDGTNVLEIQWSQRNHTFLNPLNTFIKDLFLTLDFTNPITVVSVTVDGVNIAGPGTAITTQAGMLTWINGLGKGTFVADGTSNIKSIGSQYNFDKITYTNGGPTTVEQFAQLNDRSSDITKTKVLSDFRINIPFTEPVNLVSILINGTSYPGTGFFSNAPALVVWLNTLGKGVFQTDGDDIVSLGNFNVVSQITYNTASDTNNVDVQFSQRNEIVLNPNPTGTIITFAGGTTIVSGQVFAATIPPGTYDLIKLHLPLATNPVMPANAVLYSPGYAPVIGFQDGEYIDFANVTLGNQFEIVFT